MKKRYYCSALSIIFLIHRSCAVWSQTRGTVCRTNATHEAAAAGDKGAAAARGRLVRRGARWRSDKGQALMLGPPPHQQVAGWDGGARHGGTTSPHELKGGARLLGKSAGPPRGRALMQRCVARRPRKGQGYADKATRVAIVARKIHRHPTVPYHGGLGVHRDGAGHIGRQDQCPEQR